MKYYQQVGNSVKIRFLGLPPSRYGQIETNISLIANFIPGITAEAKISTEKTTVMKMLLRKLDFIN